MILVEKKTQEIFIPKGNLNILRCDMPQIKFADFNHFFKWLGGEGISVNKNKILSGKSMKPTQKEISHEKVNRLVDINPPKLNMPFLVTQDGYILDGHHRWLALLSINKNTKIKVHVIETDIRNALKITKDYPKVTFKSIENKIIKEDYLDINECSMLKSTKFMSFTEYLQGI